MEEGRERGRMRTTNKSRGPKSRRNYGAKRARIKWKVREKE